KEGIIFSGLYTVKEYRNQGYATSLLLQMCHYYMKNGFIHCYLCADTDQPELKHIYEKIGFKTVSTNQGYRIHNMK
ncbi:MAG TPA: GNAT family N-acetyltransferase, partial [Lachnospiraceae bacterium]|nr:GNAT family N-acetyltransferase [Lachnospiraceae bacterium]